MVFANQTLADAMNRVSTTAHFVFKLNPACLANAIAFGGQVLNQTLKPLNL